MDHDDEHQLNRVLYGMYHDDDINSVVFFMAWTMTTSFNSIVFFVACTMTTSINSVVFLVAWAGTSYNVL